jgi:hypothetical protein
MTDTREWSDIAYELYALACNSRSLDPAHQDAWQSAFERLRDRLHTALDGMPGR